MSTATLDFDTATLTRVIHEAMRKKLRGHADNITRPITLQIIHPYNGTRVEQYSIALFAVNGTPMVLHGSIAQSYDHIKNEAFYGVRTQLGLVRIYQSLIKRIYNEKPGRQVNKMQTKEYST